MGAPPSFDALFACYHRPIYAYLFGMVGDAAQAQALTQDTFLTAYQALARTPDPALPAWLYRIATALGASDVHTTVLLYRAKERFRRVYVPL